MGIRSTADKNAIMNSVTELQNESKTRCLISSPSLFSFDLSFPLHHEEEEEKRTRTTRKEIDNSDQQSCVDGSDI